MLSNQLRTGLGFTVAACWFGILFVNSGAARGQDPSDFCDQAAITAAETHDVPVDILVAVTRVETGQTRDGQLYPWPWTINLNGKGFWFVDAEKAVTFADQQLDQGNENFDVGCFQINLRWHGAAFATLQDAFDPRINADYAAKFLSQLYGSEGSWEKAVAAYHSRTPDLAEQYVQKVEDVLAELQTSAPVAVPVIAPERQNRFPLLQAGATAGGGSLVPLIDSVTPLIGMP